MKLTGKQAERFLVAPDPAVRAVLVYGPDSGLVRERAGALVEAVAGDAADPFRVAELAPKRLQEEPALLADEAAALSLTGGRRAVLLREAGDALAPLLESLLAESPGEALVVVEAGELGKASSLRRLFESAERAAALPCYRDDARSLPVLIRETLAEHGLEASQPALAYLADNLGGDRLLTRRELDKLALYKGPAGGRIELEDALACVGDSAALSLDDVAFALGDGDLAGLERALQRALHEGASPVQPLRAAARHLQRLHMVAGSSEAGEAPEQAMRRLRPPVFWKHAERFKAQARAWRPPQLARALERLTEAESACKRTGAPAEAVSGRALMQVAAGSPRRRAARRS